MGMFGPGFGSVIPKWGGLSEVAQVACRAGAVGGAVYVLGKDIKAIEVAQVDEDGVEEIPRPELSQQDISKEVSDAIGASNFMPTDETSLNQTEDNIKNQSLDELLAAAGYNIGGGEDPKQSESEPVVDEVQTFATSEQQRKNFTVHLEGGEVIKADYVVGTRNDLPEGQLAATITSRSTSPNTKSSTMSRSISVVFDPLSALFPLASEGGVTPAGAVVVFPSGSLPDASSSGLPVNIIAHTSDTSECPQGSSKLYISYLMFMCKVVYQDETTNTNTYLHCLNTNDDATLTT